MQVFEFHFNPKLRPDLIFDSFCYEPENIYEKRMGNLYLVGILKNVLPQNIYFLDKLAKVIQKEYYRSTIRKPENALKESLKEANAFLEQIARKGDVSWLGNLGFAALSLKNYQLNFTKIGDLKIFLLRGKRIIDIDQKLKFEEIAPWPLKIFGNIVSGKLAEGDLILVQSKEVLELFERENLLPEITKISYQNFTKELNEIFRQKRKEILNISGICLAILLTKEVLAKKREVVSPKFYPKEFSLKEVFVPIFIAFKNLIKKITACLLPFLLKLPKLPKIKTPIWPWLSWSPKLKRNLILILALIFLLALGFFISQLQEKKELKEKEITLKEIQEKLNRAESFLILKTPEATKKANLLLKEGWEEVSKLSQIVFNLPKNFQNQVFSLKDEISKILFELNKLEIIEKPDLFFEFDFQSFNPQKMIFFKEELYFFSPYSQNLFKVNKEGKGQLLEINKKFNLATTLEDSLLFFSKPNQISILKEGKFFEFSLKEPYTDFNFDDFSSFKSNLYFLDKKSAEIIKYPFLADFQWSTPVLWLDRQEKKAIEARALAIDGSIWLLKNDNSLSRYYNGRFQERIVLEIFPEPKELRKIFTSSTLPYLYLLEPAQKRMLILNKKGEIIKQFQSQKFDNLLDLAISEDGKTIYLLNGLKVYQLRLITSD